ncbi:hypothetical protein C8A05DRAFT_18537 [Staphylotrichum tortipilum]|uniref:C2H2 type master regulator of conidiophore development brlA n=1 Tax=Staphylotrichum tortipilum TaxID=2831512 RepID=A0AAN6RQ73_9PEZI|nr:hypothetical protein C8A05DRAFT_18537 [Staphylotrichum longicolle]
MTGTRSPYRQHRRQNSTPSAFDAVKIAPLPNLQQRRLMSHRRGLSLDVRAPRLAPAPAPSTVHQEYSMARSSVAHGGPETMPKKQMQETQQQHAARLNANHSSFTSQNTGDPFLMSPDAAGQARLFAGGLTGEMPLPTDINGLPFDPFSGSLGMLDRSADQLSANIVDGSQDFEFFAADSSLSTPTFMTFPDSSPASATCQAWLTETERANADSRRSSRRISNGIMDKVAKFEAMGNGPDPSVQRPCTPNSQIGSDLFPQTPVEGSIKEEQATLQPPNRFLAGYDESMEETLKPVRNKNSNRNSGIFQDLRQQAEAMARTPPRANTMPVPALNPIGLRTPEFMNMRTLSAEFREIEREFGSIPASPSDTPSMFAFIKAHSNAFADKPDLQPVPGFDSQQTVVPMGGAPSPVSQTPSRRGSPHRRTESIASMTSAASIAGINIEESKTETGVTMDEIAAFIQGPDPTDGKWRCIYEGCNKTFGRKENIKSHVQTHLNDRQYQCPTCKKCFVRQHDLKRHAKIHTGIKPYPCECGNSFARHDALTRHRQRGMCIGAFDGVVRKVVKRGRPKKIRPDMDERRDKAERTRRKNSKAGTITSAASTTSSQSGYSDFSAANSPAMDDFHDLLEDGAPYTDVLDAHLATTTTLHPPTLGVSTAALPVTTISGNLSEVFHPAVSPSALSSYSRASSAHPTSTPHSGPEPPPSPAKSVASHYTNHPHHHPPTTPPDLSSPSSPPALSTSSHFFDLDAPPTSTLPATSSSTTTPATASDTPFGAHEGSGGSIEDLLYADAEDLLGLGDHQMLHHHHVQQMMQLGQHGHGGRGMKFEEEFDAVSMFTNGGDVFFGTA